MTLHCELPLAIEGMTQLARDDERVSFDVIDLDSAPPGRERPLVTPTLSIPGGKRVTRTPSLKPLYDVVTHVLGPLTVPNKV